MKMVAQSAQAPSVYAPTTDTPVASIAGTANIGGAGTGADDGTAVVNGSSLTVQTGDAEGLQLFFDNLTGPTTITFDYTVGVGAQMFYAIDNLLNTNEIGADRITEMLARLEIQRRSLLERFISMETAMATNARILESVQASAASLSGNSN